MNASCKLLADQDIIGQINNIVTAGVKVIYFCIVVMLSHVYRVTV